MKERLKYYQTHQLALQNDTDARTQRAIRHEPPGITEGPRRRIGRDEQPEMPQTSSSLGCVRHVVGGVLGGVGTVATCGASLVNPCSEGPASPEDFATPGETSPSLSGQGHVTPPQTQRRASPVPSEMHEAIADYQSDTLTEWLEKESRKSEKTESSRRSVQ